MATVTDAPGRPADSEGGISKRFLRLFKAQVEDWYDECRQLSDWEDRHLVDQPSADRLAQHADKLGELERVGLWLSSLCRDPDFPDAVTARLVSMTLQDLKDARALWHGTMPHQARQDILRAIFNEP